MRLLSRNKEEKTKYESPADAYLIYKLEYIFWNVVYSHTCLKKKKKSNLIPAVSDKDI